MAALGLAPWTPWVLSGPGSCCQDKGWDSLGQGGLKEKKKQSRNHQCMHLLIRTNWQLTMHGFYQSRSIFKKIHIYCTHLFISVLAFRASHIPRCYRFMSGNEPKILGARKSHSLNDCHDWATGQWLIKLPPYAPTAWQQCSVSPWKGFPIQVLTTLTFAWHW